MQYMENFGEENPTFPVLEENINMLNASDEVQAEMVVVVVATSPREEAEERKIKVAAYVADSEQEIRRLNKEIERLLPLMLSDDSAAKRVKMLQAARDIMQKDIWIMRQEMEDLLAK